MLSGCIIPTLPEMTEEQEKLITEYAAGLLLKYDTAGGRGLMTDEQLEEAEKEETLRKEREENSKKLAEEYLAKTAEAEKHKKEEKAKEKDKNKNEANSSESTSPSNFNIKSSEIGSFLGLEDGLKVSYTGLEKMSTYPNDGGSNVFAVDAAQGSELVVVHINILNDSGNDISLDMFKQDYIYQLELSDGQRIDNSRTLLLNDFSMYKDTIASGEQTDTILIFETKEGTDTSSAKLAFKKGKETGSVVE